MREFGYRDIADVEIEHEGVTRTLQDWASVLRVPYPTVRMRYRRGKRTFNELFRHTGTQGVTTYTEQEGGSVTVVHQSRTFLDDLFKPEVAQQVRDIAKASGMSPLDVVQKIVTKKVGELLAGNNGTTS